MQSVCLVLVTKKKKRKARQFASQHSQERVRQLQQQQLKKKSSNCYPHLPEGQVVLCSAQARACLFHATSYTAFLRAQNLPLICFSSFFPLLFFSAVASPTTALCCLFTRSHIPLQFNSTTQSTKLCVFFFCVCLCVFVVFLALLFRRSCDDSARPAPPRSCCPARQESPACSKSPSCPSPAAYR